MRHLFPFLLFLATALLLSACGRRTPPPPAAEVLATMLVALEETPCALPEGIIRTASAAPDSPEHLTETFLAALYGEAAHGLLREEADSDAPVTDAALFLSLSPYPCELGVFRCADGDTARTVAGLCRSRLDTLARGYVGSEWETVAAEGRVVVEQNYVILILCKEPEAAQKAARQVLGRP